MLKSSVIVNHVSKKIDLSAFFSKSEDITIIKNFVHSPIISIDSEIDELLNLYPETQLSLPDGLFTPLPYSTVNERFENETEALNTYFAHAQTSICEFKTKHVEWCNWFENKINSLFNDKINRLRFEDKFFAPFGIRILTSNKNGLDIHCENAFLHQLAPRFRDWLKIKVDIENSISIFITLQQPEKGGGLIIFDIDWDNFNLQLDSTTYEERHDLNGSIFSNRGENEVKKTSFNLENGDAILFRAAQLWHAVEPPNGTKNRITIGCFLAKGHDGNYYYWA
jgi:hypothetical protein